MNYEQLKRRVERAERLVEGRSLQTREHWTSLKRSWREGWTPARIVAAGLVSGFVSGRAEPLRALTGARLLQMVTAVSGLFASAQAAFAADQAEQAADSAGEAASAQATETQAAEAAAVAGEPTPAPYKYESPSARTGKTEAVYSTQPRPAEASTELSER